MKIFKPVYHVKETNAGYTHGIFEYSVTQGNVGTIVLADLFDGGGGDNISTNSGAGFFLKGIANIAGAGAVTFDLQYAAGADASVTCSRWLPLHGVVRDPPYSYGNCALDGASAARRRRRTQPQVQLQLHMAGVGCSHRCAWTLRQRFGWNRGWFRAIKPRAFGAD